MIKKRNNPNKAFMTLNIVLVIAVFFVVLLFLYLSFRLQRNPDKVITYEGRYAIEMTSDFHGENLRVFVNDSLLLNQVMPDSSLHISVDKFAEESVLMIVDNQTDIATLFNLDPEGSKVIVRKTEDTISIIEEKE